MGILWAVMTLAVIALTALEVRGMRSQRNLSFLWRLRPACLGAARIEV
jgi:hypothetical protein